MDKYNWGQGGASFVHEGGSNARCTKNRRTRLAGFELDQIGGDFAKETAATMAAAASKDECRNTKRVFQLLRVENAIIAAGIKHLVLHHTAHIGRHVWCRVLQASKQDDRE
jgi:hypothetical protein